MDSDMNSNAMSNYGCSVNVNLAAMIANPGDLVKGQEGLPSSDGATSGKAIKSYRDRKPTGEGDLKSEGTRSTAQ